MPMELDAGGPIQAMIAGVAELPVAKLSGPARLGRRIVSCDSCLIVIDARWRSVPRHDHAYLCRIDKLSCGQLGFDHLVQVGTHIAKPRPELPHVHMPDTVSQY